jgi:hypothetical protein
LTGTTNLVGLRDDLRAAARAEHEADAELVALCDRFIEAHKAHGAAFDVPGLTFEQEAAAEEAAEPLAAEADEYLEQILSMKAKTLQGVAAVARAALGFCDRLKRDPTDPTHYLTERLASLLARDAAALCGDELGGAK